MRWTNDYMGSMSGWVGTATGKVGSATGWVKSTTGWVGCWVGNSTYGEGRGARCPGSSLAAWTARHCRKGGGTASSRGPPGTGGRWARVGQEDSLVERSEGWEPMAGWAAKQGAGGGGGGWGVPVRGGGDGGGAMVKASGGVGTSSVGRLADGAAVRVGSGRGVPAGEGSNRGGAALVAS